MGGENKDEVRQEITKVKKLSWWQDIVVVGVILVAGALIGFGFSYIPQLEVTYAVAFSNVFEIANGIFLLLRCNEQWYAWLGYLICEMVVWILAGHYVMLITVVAMLINTIYGFIKWLVYIKNKNTKN